MLFKLNGRDRYLGRSIAKFALVKKGRYEGETNNGTKFVIEGGRPYGGSRNDWFCEIGDDDKPYSCTSVIDALDLINSNWP